MDDNKKQEFHTPNSNKPRFKGWGLFSAIFLAFFLALALSNVISPYFSQIVSGLLTGIAPILIGMVVAFIFYRLVDFVERVLLKNAFKNSPYKFGIKRTISICIVLLFIVGIFALVFAILVPRIIEIVTRLTAGGGDGGAQLYNNVVNEICLLIQKLFGAEVSQESIKEIFTSIFSWFMDTVVYLNNFLELSMSVISGLFNFLMGIIIAIFMLKDKEKISKFARRFTYAHFKKERADELCVLTKNANEILYNYIICKVIEFAILFVSLGLVFMLIDIGFAWELALIIALFNFIPYFGIYMGAIPAVLITLIFDSINSALYLILATLIVTQVEFNTIIPVITGKRLKVSALVVITSIFVGSAMFGIIGMLFAPPIAALISVVVMGNIEMKENRMKYMMELKEAREKNQREQEEQLGIIDKNKQAGEEQSALLQEQLKKEVEIKEDKTEEKTDKVNAEKVDKKVVGKAKTRSTKTSASKKDLKTKKSSNAKKKVAMSKATKTETTNNEE